MIRKKKKFVAVDWNVPSEITYLVYLSGKGVLRFADEKANLNTNHALVYGLIKGLRKRKYGCVAHVEHFAKSLGMSIRTIRSTISDLLRWKLIIQHSFDGRRRKLTTVESNSLNNTINNTFSVSQAKAARRTGNNCLGLRSSNNYNTLPNGKTGVLPVGKSVETQNGFGLVHKEKIPPYLNKYCQRFKEILKSNRMVAKWQIAKQYKHFKSLREDIGKIEFRHTFNWYVENAGTEGPDGKPVPIFSSPETYCKNYNWIKRLRDMDPDYEGPSEYTVKEILLPESGRSMDELIDD